ncbi:MAG: S-methyl-5-thioribose-1-phosphate isomerase [Firmicutes bacterium]|nr:S-methyl-5-thioribose-1-phosphate isomerase [Bacillota bacterium]
MMTVLKTIQWQNEKLILLNQTLLPNEIAYEAFVDAAGVWEAIRTMKVRGAPAIGIAAAYGLYLGVREAPEESPAAFFRVLEETAALLSTTRPTAVNLFWALERMKQKALAHKELPVARLKEMLRAEAMQIHREDEAINRSIGDNLLTLLEDGMGILTHCNAGALATSAYGTATAPLYLGKERGYHFNVYCTETRPRLQGSTLTALELQQAGIDVTVITDNMAAAVMAEGKIDAVIVGCDRLAANGDAANKIGTLGLSILARYYQVPFYVAVPTPTIDRSIRTGKEIPIEEREPAEITNRFGVPTVPKGVKVYNPAFDITPNQNISAIITEKGIVYPPYEENLRFEQ